MGLAERQSELSSRAERHRDPQGTELECFHRLSSVERDGRPRHYSLNSEDAMIRNEPKYRRLKEIGRRLSGSASLVARDQEAGLGDVRSKRHRTLEFLSPAAQRRSCGIRAMKRGEFAELEKLRVGHLLLSSRLRQGISQRELARRLDVHYT